MKVLDGSLADSLSSRFGQFSIQKTVESGNEKVCSYNKRTFFSWTVHCLRFRFSKAYRQSVIDERQEILSALDRSWQGQTFSASDDSHDSNENMRSANVMLSSRRRFNSRVSDLLRHGTVSAETGEPQATAAQQNLLDALGKARRDDTDRVLRPQDELGGNQAVRRECVVSPYVLQIVEEGLETGHEINAPVYLGPDKNGELCKHFLTFHTLTSDVKGAAGENLFKWEAVSGTFDPSKAYPTIAPEELPGEGWCLRVPSDRSVKYAAKIADAVRGMTPGRAVIFVDQKDRAKEGDAEEQHITKQFLAFMLEGLGNALLAQNPETLRRDATSAETGEPQATAAQQNLLDALDEVGCDGTDIVLRPQEELDDGQAMRHQCTAPPYVLRIVEDSLETGYVINAPAYLGPDKNGELCKHFLTFHTFTSDKRGEVGEKLFKWEDVSRTFDPSKAYPTIALDDLPGEGWHLRVPSDSSIKYAAEIADAVRGKTPGDAMIFVNQKIQAKEGDAEERHIAHQFRAFLSVGLGDTLLAQDSAI